jgi:predicted DNA-binding transcriptional regulator AlpA
MMNDVPKDPLLNARQGAEESGVSLPAFWRGVANGAFPKPVYPLPRAPRWRRSELRAVIEARRMAPCQAQAARRLTKAGARRNDQPRND